MGKRSVIAIDVGGTNTRVALFDDPARSSAVISLDPFLTEERYERQLDKITNAISKVTNEVSLNDPREGILTNPVSFYTNRISYQTNGLSIGVSIGARLMRDGGRVAVAPNLRDYEGRPFAHDLAERSGMPVRLAHDPVCGLLAE